MDYETIRETIPAEEQQLYIDAKLELRRIEEMAKLPDSEYIEMLDNIKKTGDDIQLEQFLQTYISIGEYERIKSENEAWINEIDQKYGIEAERRKEEIRVEALRKRPQLLRLQRYYERNGSYIMRNIDVAALSDEDVLRLYDEITFGIDNETLKKMLNDDIRSRLGEDNGPDDKSEKEKKDEKKEVENKIENFKSDFEKIIVIINKIKNTFILSNEWNIDVNSELKSLTVEIEDLSRKADGLISDIENLKNILGEESLSLDIKEIKKMVKDVKSRLKELKIHHIQLYNARVNMINAMIDELLLDVNLTTEIKTRLEELRMSEIDIIVRNWQHHSYLDKMDFNIFFVIIDELEKIKKITKQPDLETDMAYIESEIDRLEEFPKEDLAVEEVGALKDNCIAVANRINDFRIKLEVNKDKINEEKYQEYLDRINDAEANLALVNAQIVRKTEPIPGPIPTPAPVDENNAYKELLEKIEQLEREVNYCNNVIESLYGHIDEEAIFVFETELLTYEGRLENIEKDVEEKYKDGKLDDNQYKALIKKIEEIREIIKLAKNKLKEPEMIKDVDIFAYLNGRIDGIENALNYLEDKIESLEKPIRDKYVRKELDRIISRLEEEIKYLEGILEKHKDYEPDKYQATKERLDNVKERLDKISKKYRKKCPLLVRTVKSAKAFYKKHKKACLIVAGLAAFALVGYHVLIPAIMHGNIMIGFTSPALRGFVKFVNNVLGGVIGASKNVHGAWTLANGVMINPSVASTSLLKGLAISGIGTTALVAPMVVGIKKLVEKMKTADLKEKMKRVKEKAKPTKEKKPKDKTKKIDKELINELASLVKEYRNSGMSLDEFCTEYGLSEEEKNMIQYFEAKSNEKRISTGTINLPAMENTGRKGRG